MPIVGWMTYFWLWWSGDCCSLCFCIYSVIAVDCLGPSFTFSFLFLVTDDDQPKIYRFIKIEKNIFSNSYWISNWNSKFTSYKPKSTTKTLLTLWLFYFQTFMLNFGTVIFTIAFTWISYRSVLMWAISVGPVFSIWNL